MALISLLVILRISSIQVSIRENRIWLEYGKPKCLAVSHLPYASVSSSAHWLWVFMSLKCWTCLYNIIHNSNNKSQWFSVAIFVFCSHSNSFFFFLTVLKSVPSPGEGDGMKFWMYCSWSLSHPEVAPWTQTPQRSWPLEITKQYYEDNGVSALQSPRRCPKGRCHLKPSSTDFICRENRKFHFHCTIPLLYNCSVTSCLL